jgi:hypothetical protein
MNLALELFLTAMGFIFAIVIIAEIIYKLQASLGGKD